MRFLRNLFFYVLPLFLLCFLTSCIKVIDDGKILVKGEDSHWYINENGERFDEELHEFSIECDVIVHPTCTETGIQVFECECHKTKEVVIPALGHAFNDEYVTDAESHWNECHCGEKNNVIEHEFTIAKEVVKESSCTEKGLQVFACICGETVEKELELKKHEFTDEFYNDENNHWNECVCGEKNELVEHDYVTPGEVTLAATCKESGKQIFKCVCGASKELVTPALGHKDENEDILCDNEGCTSKVLPANNSLISLFTANQIGALISTSNLYYVEGVISEVLDAKNGVFYLQDEAGTKFYFRLPKNDAGTAHANWESKIVLGDYVKLYGKINKFTVQNKSTPSMQSPLLVEREHEHHFSDATCTDLSTCVCGYTQGDLLPHEDLNGDDLCDFCGFNVNLKLSDMIVNTLANDPNSGVLEGTSKRTWENDIFTLVVSKGTASQIEVRTEAYMRLRSGNEVSLAFKEGIECCKVEITSTSSTYATKILNAVKTMSGVSAEIIDEKIVSITFTESVSTFTFKLAATSRISNIRVYY